MDGLNKVMILGNLGADPELRMNPGGQAVLKLRVATNESWIDKEQVKQERTEWHRVTFFGRRAEGLAKFVRKGMKVFVEGRNQTSTYDKDGQKHYSTEIIADQMQMLGGRGGGMGGGSQDEGDSYQGGASESRPARKPQAKAQAATADSPEFDDDIPF